MMPTPDTRQLGRFKTALFLICLLPAGRLLWAAYTDDFGPNPVEFVQRLTGTWTFNLLLLTLCITPLRAMTDWHWLIRLRRMLGLFSFFYAGLHFLSFIGFDHAFVIGDMARLRAPHPAGGHLEPMVTAQTGRPQMAGVASEHLPDQHTGLRALFLAGQGQRVAMAAGLLARRRLAARLADS